MAQGSRYVDPNFNGGGLFDPRKPGMAFPEPQEGVPYVENAGLAGDCGCAGTSGLGKAATYDREALIAQLRADKIAKMKADTAFFGKRQNIIRMPPNSLAERNKVRPTPTPSGPTEIVIPDEAMDDAFESAAKVGTMMLVGGLLVTGLVAYGAYRLIKAN